MKFLKTPAGKLALGAVVSAFVVAKLMKAQAEAKTNPSTKDSLIYKVADTLGFGA